MDFHPPPTIAQTFPSKLEFNRKRMWSPTILHNANKLFNVTVKLRPWYMYWKNLGYNSDSLNKNSFASAIEFGSKNKYCFKILVGQNISRYTIILLLLDLFINFWQQQNFASKLSPRGDTITGVGYRTISLHGDFAVFHRLYLKMLFVSYNHYKWHIDILTLDISIAMMSWMTTLHSDTKHTLTDTMLSIPMYYLPTQKLLVCVLFQIYMYITHIAISITSPINDDKYIGNWEHTFTNMLSLNLRIYFWTSIWRCVYSYSKAKPEQS